MIFRYISQEKLKQILLLISVTSFITLYDYNLRWLIIIFLPFIFLKIDNDIKNKNLKFLYTGSFLLIFLTIHQIVNILKYDFEITNNHLLSIGITVYIFYFTYYFYENILELKKTLIYTFFLLFVISSFVGIYNNQLDNPMFCGGLKNIFFSIDDLYEKGSKFFYKNKIDGTEDVSFFSKINLSYGEYLFKENSHLGMIAPSFILVYLYYIATEKVNLFKLILFIIFLILCFIKSSTTLLAGLFFSSLLIIFFQYKKFNKKMLFLFILLITSLLIIFSNDNECKKRLIFKSDFEYTKNHSELNKNTKLKNENLFMETFNIYDTNISSQVFLYNLHLTTLSLLEKPLGWGFQNYSYAHNYLSNKYFINKVKNFDSSLTQINNKDGSNNFNKIIVEFGFFGFLLYLIIFLYLINSKINFEEKLFLIPFVITQSIRGAGYFNGGFILIIFLIIMSYIYRKKNKI